MGSPCVAERGGFEPPIRCRIHDFESCAFNHSATSPYQSPTLILTEYTKDMEETIFTRIIKGEIPCHKIYEDEHTFAFLDIHPVCEGHTLVVHKHPTQFVWDLDDAEYSQLMAAAKKIANHYRRVSGKPYVKMSIVGTDVPHNHLHLMPFATTAETHTPDRSDAEPDHDALARVAEKLRLP